MVKSKLYREEKKKIEHEDILRKPEKYLCENKQQKKNSSPIQISN